MYTYILYRFIRVAYVMLQAEINGTNSGSGKERTQLWPHRSAQLLPLLGLLSTILTD